jgi:hypothetical protein
MIAHLSTRVALASAVLGSIGISHAEEIFIKCNDESHCDRSFFSAREWIVEKALLKRDQNQAVADRLFDAYLFGNSQNRAIAQEKSKFSTEPSTIDGNIILNGSPYPRNLLLAYKISFKDKETIKIFADCANIFRCTPSAKDELAKLVKFVELNDPVVVKLIIEKEEQRKQEEAFKIKQKLLSDAIAEESREKLKQDIEDQISRRKTNQAEVIKVGALVCWYNLGVSSIIRGTPKIVRDFVGDGYQIKGFTENFQNKKNSNPNFKHKISRC